MKNYIILIIIFVLFTAIAYSDLFEIDLLGGTQLNGSGCVCHTTERDTTVSVWIEGPDTLMMGETGLYKMFLANGPAEAGGHNVAGRFGTMSLVDSFSVWDYRTPNELTQAFPLVFPTTQDTIYWEFAYTAPDSLVIDTLYSCGLSLVYDSIPDFHDRWNFGPKFPVAVVQNVIPVELVSFSGYVANDRVSLKWITSSELNNYGFNIERLISGNDKNINWKPIGFVKGNGTTTISNSYSFIDDVSNFIEPNMMLKYRLKQVDNDGSFDYSDEILAEVGSPTRFSLKQNFPNPFNPVTKIEFSLPDKQPVQLKIYDALGKEVRTLFNEEKSAGDHSINFNGDGLVSGVYYYKLSANGFSEIKKMLLLK
jgi:hypothetical protein